NNKIFSTYTSFSQNYFLLIYLQGFAPHPSSFIGIKEPKELHFNKVLLMYNKNTMYFFILSKYKETY
ncbi:hypothetical protein E6A49_03795, partial [Brachyspira pilosicoli]|nr:hypothetical protein [Brachyspira pilosicoli]